MVKGTKSRNQEAMSSISSKQQYDLEPVTISQPLEEGNGKLLPKIMPRKFRELVQLSEVEAQNESNKLCIILLELSPSK